MTILYCNIWLKLFDIFTQFKFTREISEIKISFIHLSLSRKLSSRYTMYFKLFVFISWDRIDIFGSEWMIESVNHHYYEKYSILRKWASKKFFVLLITIEWFLWEQESCDTVMSFYYLEKVGIYFIWMSQLSANFC